MEVLALRVAPIGLFDSGEGGLTVARELDRLLPSHPLVYACDSLHFPYGPRSLAEVREFFGVFVKFFREQGCQLLVVACNTATTAALLSAAVPDAWPLPTVGVVEPGAEAAARISPSGRIGVVATEATCRSGVYERILHRLRPDLRVVQRACPVLVSLAEAGEVASPETRAEVARCVAPILAESIDTLILGCTHLPHMRAVIADVVGSNIQLVDPGQETARVLGGRLGRQLASEPNTGAVREFFCTGSPSRFAHVAELLWPGTVRQVRHLPFWNEPVGG